MITRTHTHTFAQRDTLASTQRSQGKKDGGDRGERLNNNNYHKFVDFANILFNTFCSRCCFWFNFFMKNIFAVNLHTHAHACRIFENYSINISNIFSVFYFSLFCCFYCCSRNKKHTVRWAHSCATIKSKQQKYIINMHTHTHTQWYMCVCIYVYISRFLYVCVFVGAALRGDQLNTQANRIILNSVEQNERWAGPNLTHNLCLLSPTYTLALAVALSRKRVTERARNHRQSGRSSRVVAIVCVSNFFLLLLSSHTHSLTNTCMHRYENEVYLYECTYRQQASAAKFYF